MAALRSRFGHYIFALCCLLSIFLSLSFPRLFSAVADWMSTVLPHMVWPQCEFRMQVWKMLHAARWKYRTQKGAKNSPSEQHRTTFGAISSQLRNISTPEKKLLSSNISSTCPYNMVNFGPLAAEIGSLVWGTPANFNLFRVLAALLHGTLVVDVSQTLRRWEEGATYIRQGGHNVGHWSTL